MFSEDKTPLTLNFQQEAKAMHELAVELKQHFETAGYVKPGNIALKVKVDLDQFLEDVPLLNALCNPGLQDRHWKQISAVVGFYMNPDPTMTFQKVLDMDASSYAVEIIEISEVAGKEFDIESRLEAQYKEWESTTLEFEECGDKGVLMLSARAADSVQSLLDSHMTETQTLRASPFIVACSDRLREWEEFLQSVQELLRKWLGAQSVWLSLEKNRTVEPLSGLLMAEDEWRTLMIMCAERPAALAAFKRDDLLQALETAHDKFFTIQEELVEKDQTLLS